MKIHPPRNPFVVSPSLTEQCAAGAQVATVARFFAARCRWENGQQDFVEPKNFLHEIGPDAVSAARDLFKETTFIFVRYTKRQGKMT
jgi:hypothetical protein